ncbi:hypothetical protein RAS1_15060 [Phycisphaerae bacterium RAS1]|nr:hypothetical protein RAS1_15060 [Phycisphaerae bacterium RAS1]
MIVDVDLFILFRTVIFAVVAAQLFSSITAWSLSLARALRGEDPHRRLLRVYLSYHLVTVRSAPLVRELWQIALCIAFLITLWALHARV